MPREFVWAIDEDGKPCKCFAKPENRGKRNCKHRFHAREGEDQQSFFDRFLVDSSDLEHSYPKKEDITREDLPSYDEIIKSLVSSPNEKYDNWSEVVEKVISSDYLNNSGIPFMEGVDVKVVEEEDEGDSVRIYMDFAYDGEHCVTSFAVPKVDDKGEFDINGSKYRCIPSLTKYKEGLSVSDDNLILLDRNGKGCGYMKKDGGEAFSCVYYDDNLKKKWIDIPKDKIEKVAKGDSVELTDEELKALNRVSEIGFKRIADVGLDALQASGKDKPNDISYRGTITLEDRVAFSISKKFKSMDSIYRKNVAAGRKPDFRIANMEEIIKRDLVGCSNVQLADDINPIAALSQSQRVSYCGAGSYSKDALPENVRFSNESYYGIVDVNDTALGGSIGASIAVTGGKIGKDGVISKSEKRVSCSDFIPYVEHSDPTRGCMAVSQMKQALPISGGEDPVLSTPGWDKIKGAKLGVNFKVAYVPDDGVWEDAVIISESAAKKMTTVQSKKYQLSAKKYDGHVDGDVVNSGDIVCGQKIEYSGKIKNMSDTSFEVETVYPMGVGDKLAGRHGNKGVISKVCPDNEMPKAEDGSYADVIMSPIGIAGRSNLGQVYEVNGGKDINKKSTLTYKGHKIEATYGTQFVMRLNQIADKKIHSESNNRNKSKEFKARFGEMESLLMSSNQNRLDVLNYLKRQEKNLGEEKLLNTLKGLGISIKPVE